MSFLMWPKNHETRYRRILTFASGERHGVHGHKAVSSRGAHVLEEHVARQAALVLDLDLVHAEHIEVLSASPAT